MTENSRRVLAFIQELEKLKTVTRQNKTLDEGRWENSAEHSWHVAMMALLMQEFLPENVDITRVVKMLLIHDIVEIDTGDVYLYDEEKRKAVALKEAVAAERLFGLLPEKQKQEYLELWTEFEAKETPEAQAAGALDTLQPLINHDVTGTENRHGMTRTRVTEKKLFIKDVSPELWAIAEHLIDKGVEKGLFFDS